MKRPLVIARAACGQPLKRVVTGTRRVVVFLANPDAMDFAPSAKSQALVSRWGMSMYLTIQYFKGSKANGNQAENI